MMDYIARRVNDGQFNDCSEFINLSIKRMIERIEIDEILKSSIEARSGTFYTGDLREVIKTRLTESDQSI